MKINEFKELIDYIEQSSIDVLQLEDRDLKLYFQKHNAANVKINVEGQGSSKGQTMTMDEITTASEQLSLNKDNGIHKIKAPMVGTFYSRSNPDTAPFVQLGSKIKKNQPVCVLEAMKLFNEVASDVNGEIVEILAEDGQIVEFGQPLFVIKVSD
ncbi:acetyl-CoA carboxylase biotin carboxyl carrier protein [Pseudobacillus wudalianchiensis]|nr:acetyl-CoA carboxylase biotin carboxyl carrier protein [Bacillus wudalianchiensis]